MNSLRSFPRGRASGEEKKEENEEEEEEEEETARSRARENLNSMFKIGISYKTSCRGYI